MLHKKSFRKWGRRGTGTEEGGTVSGAEGVPALKRDRIGRAGFG